MKMASVLGGDGFDWRDLCDLVIVESPCAVIHAHTYNQRIHNGESRLAA